MMKEKLKSLMNKINSKIGQIGIDRVLHFFVGAWITAECKAFSEPLLIGIAFLFMFLIGYFKEKLMDQKYDFIDLWYGAAGAMFSLLLYVPYHAFCQ